MSTTKNVNAKTASNNDAAIKKAIATGKANAKRGKEDAPVDNPSKRGAAKKTLTQINLGKAAEKAESKKDERVPKYIYPADVKTQEEKKAFRRQSRSALASYEKKIAALNKSNEASAKKELEKMQKELTGFKKATYTAK